MSFLIGLLTVVLVLNCALLILLVLVQPPRKEAAAALGSGAFAADTLFGSASVNVMAKAIKYATIAFFVVVLLLAVLQNTF